MSTTTTRFGHGTLMMAAVLLLFLGSRALLMPDHAEAISCGAGEDECSSSEHSGYDRFCFDLGWLFKFCYEVTYYHPPEPDEEDDDGNADNVPN